MIRFFDIFFSCIGLCLCFPLFIIIYVLCLFDTGAPLFRQERVGLGQSTFLLIKFRTMKIDAASMATHLIDKTVVTRLGRALRSSKLDELPQLWNVLKGDMSLVGPRPCLSNQIDLITERALRNVFDIRPGITGLAQIKSVDMSTPRLLAEIDAEMLGELSIVLYFKIIFKTLLGYGRGDSVK